jgi:DNA-binding transcriptional regulator PaaX
MRDTFKLMEVELAWKQFMARFAPVVEYLADLSQAEAFFVRTLLDS